MVAEKRILAYVTGKYFFVEAQDIERPECHATGRHRIEYLHSTTMRRRDRHERVFQNPMPRAGKVNERHRWSDITQATQFPKSLAHILHRLIDLGRAPFRAIGRRI